MSGMAVYGLKSVSLLQFEQDMQSKMRKKNLTQLFDIENVPSDTYMRERLDVFDSKQLQPVFTGLIRTAEEQGILDQFKFWGDRYLIPLDGTQFFESNKINCDHCCTKHHKKSGTTSYHHQALGAAIVHPNLSYVLPLLPEFICKTDGAKKNDCERNAAKRLVNSIKQTYPHLKFIVVEDALYANAPHIQLLEKLDMQYIIVAKETDHKYLFASVKMLAHEKKNRTIVKDGITHYFEFMNDVPLNETHPDVRVNFLYYKQTDKHGVETTWTWITNIPITLQNVYKIMKGGRARWHIENNTFNTLKNQGYNFEHNFGHGYKYLANTMVTLMLLAFAIDQIQMISSKLFQTAKTVAGSYSKLWQHMTILIDYFLFDNWEELLNKIAHKNKRFCGLSP